MFLEDFGIPVPGETVLIAGAIYAGAGRLNVVAVAVIAFVAAILGDNVGYAIGRLAGHEAIVKWGKYVLLTEERMAKAEDFFARRGGRIVVVARFVEGLRQANGIVAGITEMHWIKFVAFNALGAAIWVGLWTTVGYTSGSHIESIYTWFSRFALYLLAALVVVVVVLIIRFRIRRKARLSLAASDHSETTEGAKTP